MKPSERCKAAGLKNLAQLSDEAGVSVQTLNNWHKYKPRLFVVVLMGVVLDLANREEGENAQAKA